MVRNGVPVPIHWHIIVQVGPRRLVRLVLDPWWWWFMVIAGLALPIRRAGGGFASPTEVNAAKIFTASSLISFSIILRDVLKLVQAIVVMKMNSRIKYFVYLISCTTFT